MPYLRVELAGPVPSEMRRELMHRTAEVFAEVIGSPVERVRTQVHELPADAFAVGGVTIAESHEQAPFISLDLLADRPTEQRVALIERISPLVADIVGVPLERVRMRINPVPPDCWGIAGVPASQARKPEIDARSNG
jgi:4-oxalocrotonate tautomerase family enzyme